MFTRFVFTTIIVILLTSCSGKSGTDKKDVTTYQLNPVESDTIVTDTIVDTFPVRINNDHGTIRVFGIHNYKNQKLIGSDFLISLNDIPNTAVSEKLNKHILIDSNTTPLLKDTLHQDFLRTAVLKKVDYDFVRTNTLYFRAVLENSVDGKEITGRFGLLYKPKKKVKFYGWITDEIKDIR